MPVWIKEQDSYLLGNPVGGIKMYSFKLLIMNTFKLHIEKAERPYSNALAGSYSELFKRMF